MVNINMLSANSWTLSYNEKTLPEINKNHSYIFNIKNFTKFYIVIIDKQKTKHYNSFNNFKPFSQNCLINILII